jgi:AcrR family transcriptional regulator
MSHTARRTGAGPVTTARQVVWVRGARRLDMASIVSPDEVGEMSSAPAQAHGVTTARRAQTRDRLMQAAVGVFAERGIIGASVEEICDRAGFTRGAFYSNFADKDQFVLAMLQRQTERDVQAVEAITGEIHGSEQLRSRPPATVITMAVSQIFGDPTADRDTLLAWYEMELYAARRPQLREAYRQHSQDQTRRVATLLRDALAAIGVTFTVEPTDMMTMLHGCWSRLQLTALVADGPVDPRPLEVLLQAITRPKES